jgi:hypothetical protein
MGRFPTIRLFVKGVVLGVCGMFLHSFFQILLAMFSSLLSETETGNYFVIASMVIFLLYHLSLIGIGVWTGLQASSRGWLFAGSVVFSSYLYFPLSAVIKGELKTGGTLLLVGASLAGLGALGTYVGDLVRKRQFASHPPG